MTSGLTFGLHSGSVSTTGQSLWMESYPGVGDIKVRMVSHAGASDVNTMFLSTHLTLGFENVSSHVGVGSMPDVNLSSRKDSTDRDSGIWGVSNNPGAYAAIELVTQSTRWIDVYSKGTDELTVHQGNTGVGFPRAIAYSAVTLGGSVQIGFQEFAFWSRTPAYVVMSLDFQPDLVFLSVLGGKTTTGYTTLSYLFAGYTDMRSGPNRFRTNAWASGYSTTLNDYGTYTLAPSNHYVQPYNAANDMKWEINSVDSNGHTLVEVKSTTGGLHTRAYGILTGLKFGSGAGIYVGRGNAGSSLGTRSFQCNSVNVEFLLVNWTDSNTRVEQFEDGVFSYSNLGNVMWTKSQGWGYASANIDGGGVAGEASYISNSLFMFAYDPGFTTERWRAYSMDAGSNGWSATFTTSTQVPDSQINYLAIGAAMPAPAHLMGADGQSIFLADNSENWDNLLLTGGVVVTSTTFRASLLASSVDQGVRVETYDLNGQIPKLRWDSCVLGATVVNTDQTNAHRFNWGTTTYSSGTSFKDVYVGTRERDGQAVPDRIGHMNNDWCGGFLQAGGTTTYLTFTRSANLDSVAIDGSINRGANQYPYRATTMAGSITTDTGVSTVLNTISSGSSILCSLAFQPDLILLTFPHAGAQGINSEQVTTAYGFTHGFYDTRSSYGRFLNHAYTNATSDIPVTHIDTVPNLTLTNGPASRLDIDSVSAAGFYIKVTEVNCTAVHVAQKVSYSAIKFDDPTVDFKIQDYNLPLSSQTESLGFNFGPKFALLLGTTTQSFAGFPSAIEAGRHEAYTLGMWTEGNTPGTVYGWSLMGASTTDTHVGDYHGQLATYRSGAGGTEIANIRSVTVSNSTALNFYADVTTTWAQNLTGALLVIGAQETEAGSTPVSSEGPAAGPAPLFRKFPTTENQEFPTPIYEIRKFPSE